MNTASSSSWCFMGTGCPGRGGVAVPGGVRAPWGCGQGAVQAGWVGGWTGWALRPYGFWNSFRRSTHPRYHLWVSPGPSPYRHRLSCRQSQGEGGEQRCGAGLCGGAGRALGAAGGGGPRISSQRRPDSPAAPPVPHTAGCGPTWRRVPAGLSAPHAGSRGRAGGCTVRYPYQSGKGTWELPSAAALCFVRGRHGGPSPAEAAEGAGRGARGAGGGAGPCVWRRGEAARGGRAVGYCVPHLSAGRGRSFTLRHSGDPSAPCQSSANAASRQAGVVSVQNFAFGVGGAAGLGSSWS